MLSTTTYLDESVRNATESHKKQFGNWPAETAAAPGRVNLIGEHVDYNDGIVLPFAINRYTTLTGSRNDQSKIRIWSEQQQELVQIDLPSTGPVEAIGGWTDYVVGVVAELRKRGFDIMGFDAVVASNVPLGSGLSSSAALEVATATMLEALFGFNLTGKEKALLCQAAEHNYAGVPCGIMDQFCSVFGSAGKLVKIDCMTCDVELISMANAREYSFVVANSMVSHELSNGEYALRKAQSESALEKAGISSYRDAKLDDFSSESISAVEFQRARHVVTEIERTRRAAQLISTGDWLAVGQLLLGSHRSLRDDYEVSCRELDLLVEISENSGGLLGVLGSRMTGGGFGGCTISVVKTESVASFVELVKSEYKKLTNLDPLVFSTTPSAGAQNL